MYEDAISFFESRSVPKLTKWLMIALPRGDFYPLDVPYDLESIALDLHRIIRNLPVELQEKFKETLLHTVVELDLSSNQPVSIEIKGKLLSQLALLGAYTRTSHIVSPLRVIIEEGFLDVLSEDTYNTLMEKLIGVIAGFATMPEAGNLLKRLMLTSSISDRFAAQLFLGLAEYQPEGYPEYLPKFLQIARESSEKFDLDFVFGEFVRIVTVPAIFGNITRLNFKIQEDFIDCLCTYEWSPFRYILDIADPHVANPFEKRDGIFLETRGNGDYHHISLSDYLPSATVEYLILKLLPKRTQKIREMGSVKYTREYILATGKSRKEG